MNVLSVIHYSVFGGPHNRNVQVAPLLNKQGIKTVVLLPDDEGNAASRLRAAGVEVIQMPLSRIRTKYNLWLHLKYFAKLWGEVSVIRKLIRDANIQVVQINGLVNPHAAIAANFEHVPVVWQILDTFPPMLLRRLMMLLVSRLASVVMCTGKKVAQEHPGAMDNPERLQVFFPPVNLEIFKPDVSVRERVRQELGFCKGEVVVGNVSNINRMKGHIWFIRAAAILRKNFPNTRFVLLGAIGEAHMQHAEQLWKEAENLGLNLGTDLIVLDPNHRVAELAQSFDVFWMMPEPNSEGVPTVIEEAMALGLPVVAADVGSISEIVTDGVTGFVVPVQNPSALAEATEGLLNDPKLRESFSVQARQFALENFSAQSCANLHLSMYRKAVGIQVNG